MVKLVVKEEGDFITEFEFSPDQRVTIGRRPDSDVCLQHPAISSEHAFIYTNHATFIQDNASTNGTFVKGRRISRTVLMEGDEIQMGPYTIVYSQRRIAAAQNEGRDKEVLDKTMIFSNIKLKGGEPGIMVLSGSSVGKIISLNEPFVTLGEPGKHAALVMKKPNGYSVSQIKSSSPNPGDQPTVNGLPLDEMGTVLQDQDVIHVSGNTHRFVSDINSLKTTSNR